MHLGLALVHVDARGEQTTVVQRVGERGFVDDWTARGVHEHRGRLQQRESPGVDQVRGLRPQRHVQTHDVGRAEQLVEVARSSRAGRCRARVVQHRHPEPGGPPRHRLADAAVAHDPERGAVHVGAQVLRDRPARPAVAAEVALGLGRQSGRGEDQQEGEVGGGLVEHARRVAHRDAALGRGAVRRCCRSPRPRSRPPVTVAGRRCVEQRPRRCDR